MLSRTVMSEFLDYEEAAGLETLIGTTDAYVYGTCVEWNIMSGWSMYHWRNDLLTKGRLYTCFKRKETKAPVFEMKGLTIKVPKDWGRQIMVHVELAEEGRVHPSRFFHKWLPDGEPASRLAIHGTGTNEGWYARRYVV